MNKCRNCGTEFKGKFCPECGTPIPINARTHENRIQQQLDVQESKAQQMKTCPTCGFRYRGTFCPRGCNRPKTAPQYNASRPATSGYGFNGQMSGFACPRCGGRNVTVQAITQQKTRGCLSVCLWILLAFCTCGIGLLLIPILKGRKSITSSCAVCQNCGHRWTV